MGEKKIAFAGFGAMGQTMLKGFLAHNTITPDRVAVLSRSAAGKDAAGALGVVVCETSAELAAFADIIILAVKPK
ncbi:MAG: NAD(P)-binding domain-containing protein, partial [Spirochaetaceae bacterium]|nr:NAD(P)-binding domain-containing protein [Spirochaetaceae bacterium]